MTILYIGYWGANEGLSQATINPHLKILEELGVERIVYISIERQLSSSFIVPKSPRIIHIPIFIHIGSFHILSKWLEFIKVYRCLKLAVRNNKPNFIFCRSALAGIFGYWLHRRFNIQFYVESFEPHGAYMIESNVWSQYGPSYLFYQWHEKRIIESAKMLMPVARNFLQKLLETGVPSKKLRLMPCAIDIEGFAFNSEDRKKIRLKLGIESDTVVGIYVGKFGGMYLDQEAFEIFHQAFNYFENFFLLLLTPRDSDYIKSKIDTQFHHAVWINQVPHIEVPKFLSASDFAFSFHKDSASTRYLSPIKNGEYWANGLPILIKIGIGDDSQIIEEARIGVVIKDEIGPKYFNELSLLIQNQELRPKIEKVARIHRSFETTRQVYQEIINENHTC